MPLKFLSLMMKSKGEGSSRGAELEYYSRKRTPGDLNADEVFLMNSLMKKSKGEGSSRGAELECYSRKRTPGDLNAGEGFLMNSLMMKSKGEGSSRGAELEYYSRKRTPGDLNAGEGSQVRDPKKTKMERSPAPRASLGHCNILQPGENWTSREYFPVEVFEGFKLGGDAKFYDGLTRGEITSRCLKGMGQVLSDFVRIVEGFGSGGGGDEVDNLWKALEQSEKEKAVLREEVSSLDRKSMYETPFAMRLQLEQSEKDKADIWKKVEFFHNLYNKESEARLRLEEEQVLLKAELEELKAREDKRVQIELEMAKDDTANNFKEHFPA